MDREIGRIGIINKIRDTFILVWAIMSAALYAGLCILLSPVAPKLARYVARLWSCHLLLIAGVKLSINGLDKLDKSKRYVFIANHQSALDIPVLYAGINQAISFIAKKELFLIPIFGWGMAAVGHVWIDRSNARKARDSINKAVNHLRKSNVSLVLFPEGTRSVDGVIGDFKTGSFSLALQSGVQAVPCVIHDSRNCLKKGASFILPGTIHLDICEPIDLDESTMSKADVGKKVREIICEVAAKGPSDISK